MADTHDEDRRPSFHWPPTAEELESIEVLDMSGEKPAQSPRPHLVLPPRRMRSSARMKPAGLHRRVEESVVTQAALLAASLAAIGIAVTSLFAPAQPVGRAPKTDARTAGVTPAPAPTPTTASAEPALSQPAFRPMVTLELEKPTPRLQTEPKPPAAPPPTVAAVTERSTVSEPRARTHEPRRNIRSASASPGRDPVSRFAVRTGVSVWKVMRAVGRSLKRDSDQNWSSRPTTHSADARRTAGAADLEDENFP